VARLVDLGHAAAQPEVALPLLRIAPPARAAGQVDRHGCAALRGRSRWLLLLLLLLVSGYPRAGAIRNVARVESACSQ
jgi:hypothetical protein